MEHCPKCQIPLGMSHPPSYTCWDTCPCHKSSHPITDNDTWEKEFDEKLTYGVVYSASSDLSSGKSIEMRYTDPEPVKDFIRSLLLQERRRVLQEVKEKLEVTFTGCACGLHGFQVLPDCEIEIHTPEKCARCSLRSIQTECCDKCRERCFTMSVMINLSRGPIYPSFLDTIFGCAWSNKAVHEDKWNSYVECRRCGARAGFTSFTFGHTLENK